jgi:AcrR family transcriptional regulator
VQQGTEPGRGAAATLAAPRRRDADATRQALLAAARRRFARHGFAAATVRDIAADAGVNVALISRYFDSKIGLFEACLQLAEEAVTRSAGAATDLTDAAAVISRELAGTGPDGAPPDALVLLLRSSGDAHAERIRVDALRASSERLAVLAGWRPDSAGGDGLLLRAQLVLATALGAAVLRASGGPAPLLSASEADLGGPLRDVVTALLGPRAAAGERLEG